MTDFLLFSCKEEKQPSEAFVNSTLQIIFERKSVREYAERDYGRHFGQPVESRYGSPVHISVCDYSAWVSGNRNATEEQIRQNRDTSKPMVNTF
jgi:hypothetical protein